MEQSYCPTKHYSKRRIIIPNLREKGLDRSCRAHYSHAHRSRWEMES